jgi:endogenous inhibitor of DNA gyrase (YacG/DUF329 family)
MPRKAEAMGGAAAARPGRKCPICGKPTVAGFRPFCSKRCADIDLHRWLSGAYAIPAAEDEPPGEPANDNES